MRYMVDFAERLDSSQITNAILFIRSEASRYTKLDNYYKGQNENIRYSSASIGRNPVSIPYGRKIINTVVGYMFKPGYIGYSSDNKQYKQDLDDIFWYNNEDEITSEVGKMCSVLGKAYELHFLKEVGTALTPRFVPASPAEMVAIYSHDIKDDEIKAAVRVYTIGDEELVDIYYSDIVEHFITDKAGKVRELEYLNENDELISATEENPYGMVPVAEYINNEEQIGDFEPVLSLIDAYDVLISDSINEIDKLAEAYLVLTNNSMKPEDVKDFRHKRIIELHEQGRAEYLVKNVNPALLQFMRDWIRQEIHSQAQIPDMSDQQFAGQQSGVAIRYKMNDLENICSMKEIYFRKGLYRRLDLLDAVIDTAGEVKDIEVTFTRNIPMNYVEIAQIVKDLRGHISLQTLLEQIVPFVINAEDEIKRLSKEKDRVEILDEDDEDDDKDDELEDPVE